MTLIMSLVIFIGGDVMNELKKLNKKRVAQMICTPKVRQTFGGAYFYGKKGTNIQKVLARVQIICYTRYARTQVELSRNNAKIFSAFD